MFPGYWIELSIESITTILFELNYCLNWILVSQYCIQHHHRDHRYRRVYCDHQSHLAIVIIIIVINVERSCNWVTIELTRDRSTGFGRQSFETSFWLTWSKYFLWEWLPFFSHLRRNDWWLIWLGALSQD